MAAVHDPPAPPAIKRLLTARDCAKLLGVSERTLSRLTYPKGELPAVRLGPRLVRYDQHSVEQWIAEKEATGANDR